MGYMYKIGFIGGFEYFKSLVSVKKRLKGWKCLAVAYKLDKSGCYWNLMRRVDK